MALELLRGTTSPNRVDLLRLVVPPHSCEASPQWVSECVYVYKLLYRNKG